MKRMIKLQKLITSATWICKIRCPAGVNNTAWSDAINDLFNANQLIHKINKEERR
jgi:hypothetical protein